MKLGRAATLVAALWAVVTAPLAAPFTPAHDDQVVQTLSTRWDAGTRQKYVQWTRRPQQLSLALSVSHQAIEQARLTGDPRELGLAQAALAPWWNMPTPPPAVQLLRATLAQSQHQFTAALQDLDGLVNHSQAPLSLQAQAGLTRAAVLQATGALASARQACADLLSARFASLGLAVSVPARACVAEVQSLQGQPLPATVALAALAREAPGHRWLALVRAELAQRMNDPIAAQARFAEALSTSAQGTSDVYTRAAYADWLLERGQPQAVVDLIPAGMTLTDALLLRRAIALHRLQSPQATAAATALQARFVSARQRNAHLHAREEARLALDVQGQFEHALQLARDNWRQQKEPADAVLLWRAAVAAGQPFVAQTLIGCSPDPARADLRLTGLCQDTQP